MTLRQGRAGRDHFIDRLEPRGMMLYAGAIIVLAFVLANPIYLAVLAAVPLAVAHAAGRARLCRPYLLAGGAAAIAVAVLNPIVSREGTTVLLAGPVLPVVGHLTVTAEAVVFGLGMALRFFCVVSVVALYTTTVDPDAALRIVSRVSFGSALVAALAVRLFPTVAEDAARITDAQRCRGLKLDGGWWWQRAMARKPLVDCLLLTSLERAVQLSESMESRGYGIRRRTVAPATRWQRRDFIIGAASGTALVFGVGLALGPGSFEYYPTLRSALSVTDLPAVVGLALLLLMPAVVGWGWRRSHWLRSRI